MSKIKTAFTLFELILVIFIIGVIYTLVGVGFNSFENSEQKLSLQNLKYNLLQNKDLKLPFEFVCFDSCKKCVVLVDNKVVADEFEIALDEHLEIMNIDKMGNFERFEHRNRFINNQLEKVCFEFKIYENGSSDKLLIKNFDKFYIFHSFFGDVNITSSEEDAKLLFYNEKEYPTDESKYRYDE